MGGHFERVAAVYDSLRTTDEAPVRRIGQFLPDRPVTGLDTGPGFTEHEQRLHRRSAASLANFSASASADSKGSLMSGNSGNLSRTVSSAAPAGVRGAARASPHSSAQSFCQSSAPRASAARSAGLHPPVGGDVVAAVSAALGRIALDLTAHVEAV